MLERMTVEVWARRRCLDANQERPDVKRAVEGVELLDDEARKARNDDCCVKTGVTGETGEAPLGYSEGEWAE